MNRADVIVIGGGLMGSSTALNLAQQGKTVLILEKEINPCHASAVNAGGVRRLNRAIEEIPLSLAAMDLWHRIESIVGSDCGFEPVGQVRIARDHAAMAELENRVSQLRQLGFDHEKPLSADAVKRLVPAYSGPCAGGVASLEDGHALPAKTLRAFFNAAQAKGARAITRCRVADISPRANGFTVTAVDGRHFQAEAIVNCAGAWGKQMAAIIRDDLPIMPVGLSMMVTARMPRFIRPVIGIHGKTLSFKQMANGSVVIGGGHLAILDMHAEKTVIDFSKMRQSAQTVCEHFPIMQQATVVRCWAGIEGLMTDRLPVIGESPATPGMFHVCGFSAHGFQLSPMVGRVAASLVLGRKPEISLHAFRVNRFTGSPSWQTSSIL